ncbi:MAG: mechanosensitive ion channel family protein [Bacteroidota bacterium]
MQDTTTVITEDADASDALTLADLTGAEFWLALGVTALRVVIILAVALFIIGLVRKLMLRWRKETEDLPAIDPRRQRAFTVSNLIMSATRYVVWTMASITVLSEIGLDIGPLLAGAGIAGLAIGFGAQTLVKDVISGVFLLFDDIIHVGDLVVVGPTTGTVEAISLRLVKIRKFDGELVMIPAGDLRAFGNKSVGFARVVVPVGVSYEQDLDEILDALNEVAQEWAAKEGNKEIMLEEAPTVQAVTSLGDSSVEARIIVQVIPGEQFPAERALRALIKRRFDEQGIEIPFPRRTVYVRNETELPARSFKQAAPDVTDGVAEDEA